MKVMLQINVTSWVVERSRTLIGLLCSIQDDSASLTVDQRVDNITTGYVAVCYEDRSINV